MAEENVNTTDIGAGAEVEMSEDSGYTDSIESSAASNEIHMRSDASSVSGDSTTTVVGTEETSTSQIKGQGIIQSVNSWKTKDTSPSLASGQRLSASSLQEAKLPFSDSAARTEKWVEDVFEVFVKNLDGKTHTIEVKKSEEVSVLRQKVCEKIGVPGDQQRLTSQEGRTLEDGKSLCDYNIKKHSTIYCQGRLRGG